MSSFERRGNQKPVFAKTPELIQADFRVSEKSSEDLNHNSPKTDLPFRNLPNILAAGALFSFAACSSHGPSAISSSTSYDIRHALEKVRDRTAEVGRINYAQSPRALIYDTEVLLQVSYLLLDSTDQFIRTSQFSADENSIRYPDVVNAAGIWDQVHFSISSQMIESFPDANSAQKDRSLAFGIQPLSEGSSNRFTLWQGTNIYHGSLDGAKEIQQVCLALLGSFGPTSVQVYTNDHKNSWSFSSMTHPGAKARHSASTFERRKEYVEIVHELATKLGKNRNPSSNHNN